MKWTTQAVQGFRMEMTLEKSVVFDSPETIQIIQNSKLFQGVPAELLEPMFSKARRITLRQGSILLAPNKVNENVYVILSGQMSVQVTPSSLENPLAIITQGECVGEMSVLVDGLASAYVIAVSDCELFSIDYGSFWSLIDGSNEAARNMLNILVYRIRLGNESIADSLLHRDDPADSDSIDKLTGLFNYHGLRRKFDRLLHRRDAGKQPHCLIVLKVDTAEHGNSDDEKSHADQLLRSIAQTILTFLRPDDNSARLIGSKFAILLSDISLSAAIETAERLRTAISNISVVMPDGNSVPKATISAGIGDAYPEDTCGTLIARVDQALAKAISEGGDQVKSV
ncbi:MAG: GGDEF domain-containing protein [Gallionella sp.]